MILTGIGRSVLYPPAWIAGGNLFNIMPSWANPETSCHVPVAKAELLASDTSGPSLFAYLKTFRRGTSLMRRAFPYVSSGRSRKIGNRKFLFSALVISCAIKQAPDRAGARAHQDRLGFQIFADPPGATHDRTIGDTG